jgi:hypothetical protein
MFTVQPSNAQTGTTITPPVEVTALNQFGEVDLSYTGTITVRIGTNPGSGTLFGNPSVSAVAGVAIFNNLMISGTGDGYTLIAEAVGLTSDESAAFNITP